MSPRNLNRYLTPPSRLILILAASLSTASCLSSAGVPAAQTETAGRIQSVGALDESGLENLVGLARIVGLLRYFHPSDESANIDWDGFAAAGVELVESARTPAELVERLTALIQPIAPTVRIRSTQSEAAGISSSGWEAEATRVVQWSHEGVGGGNPAYTSERIYGRIDDSRIPLGFHDPRQPLRVELEGGLTVDIPLAVYADESGTLPRMNRTSEVDRETEQMAQERTTHLAAVVLGWNVLAHFYPYFEEVEVDWPTVLHRSLTAAATDPDACAFRETLARMVGSLEDGHGWVNRSGCLRTATPPIAVDWVESQLVVLHVDTAGIPLQRGDVIEMIDGRPTSELLAEAGELTPAATPWYRTHKAIDAYLLAGRRGTEIKLAVNGSTGGRNVSLIRSRSGQQTREPRLAPLTELQPGIIYLPMDRTTPEAFEAALPRLEAAEGIVFDLREYPSPGLSLPVLSRIIEWPVRSPQWYVPRVIGPERPGVQLSRWPEMEWTVEPADPYLKAARVFISGPRAISQSETILQIVDYYGLGEIVGGPTGGTNGDVTWTDLAGDYRMVWTGLGVRRHDGSRHHGIGVVPTFPVSRTRAGVAAGLDESLEVALRILSSSSAAPSTSPALDIPAVR